MSIDWTPTSWQTRSCEQAITYPCAATLEDVLNQLSQRPTLVTSFEIDRLQQQLAEAAQGKRFVLQGGDCAESFAHCQESYITSKLKILLQMSLILIHGLRKPVIRVGRIAGQYAKPRSTNTETRDQQTLLSYRGDLINQPQFNEKARTPNPKLLLQGYNYAAITLNYLRALVDGGFADLQHPENWDLDFVQHSAMADDYKNLVNAISDALSFVKIIKGVKTSSLNQIEFYTSHEALHLPYEQALSRRSPDGKWYNVATHFPWVGMRTADLDSAHVEYLRGIANPIAVKVGPSADTKWLKAIVQRLNPDNQAGHLSLITRFGEKQVATCLPPMIKTLQTMGATVVWLCDPMHGNTHTTNSGIKTRHFDDILSELQQAFHIHRTMHSHLGGVHFELTGENVTECIGGARDLQEQDLSRAYQSLLDPRLNYEQSLEMALLLAKMASA